VSITVNNEATAPDTRPGTRPDTAPDVSGLDISALRVEIDTLDEQILQLIKRRSEVSQRIGAIRRAEGGPRIVLSREQAVLARFRDLGPEGRELGMLLLRLGRGRLGRS
jgi:chorismate mutase